MGQFPRLTLVFAVFPRFIFIKTVVLSFRGSVKMRSKIFRLVNRFVKFKIESYSSRENETYTCLIFVMYMRKVFQYHRRILTIFSCICFQLITVPLILQLVFLTTKSTKFLFSQMFETLYCSAVSIEYVLLVLSDPQREKLMLHFNRVFIKKHKIVRKILCIELIVSAIFAMILLTGVFLYFVQSIHPPLSPASKLTPRRYPHRRFKNDFLLPFDYSISPLYEIGWVLLIYYGFALQSVQFETATTMPLITLHIKGQLDIIAYYLRSIGEFEQKI